MYQDDMYYKELLFNSWFEKVTKYYKEMRNGKTCDITVEIRYAPFTKTFNKAYKKNFKYYDSQTDCFSDCMMLVWEALCSFEIKDGSNWKAIYEETDKANVKRLNQYIKTYVNENMKRLNFDYIETTKLTLEDSERYITHVFYRVTPDSLHDIVTLKNPSEKIEVLDTVEHSYWEKRNDYKRSIFLEWMKDNVNDCLKDTQIKLLAELKDANYSVLDKDFDSEKIKPYKSNLKLKLKRIYERIINKYKKEEKFLTGGFVLNELKKEYETFEKYIDILEKENVNQNELSDLLSKHVLNSMNNKYWENLIYEILPKEVEKVLIREYQRATLIHESDFKLYGKRIQIPNVVLNKITKAIHERLDELEMAMLKEIGYLRMLGEKEDKNVKLMYFDLPKSTHKMVYLNVSPNGIMFQE